MNIELTIKLQFHLTEGENIEKGKRSKRKYIIVEKRRLGNRRGKGKQK